MANQFYGYKASYGGGSNLSSAYASRLGGSSATSLSGGTRYSSGSDTGGVGGAAALVDRLSSAVAAAAGGSVAPSLFSSTIWATLQGLSSSSVEPPVPGVKRTSEALYHPTVLGTHNTVGQNEALFTTNSLVKRPRYETMSNLPMYPQRPGEKDCAYYMLTRTCKFGDACKFDHPLWVPEGGIPDWKEVPLIPTSEGLPLRAGEPDCPYFLKTQKCKFGSKCKFNHPMDKVESTFASAEGASEVADVSLLPQRPSEPVCSYYMKTGKCKFGLNCKFHHPKDIQSPTAQDHASEERNISTAKESEPTGDHAKTANPFVPVIPASSYNSKGLPMRTGEVDCPFYLKTGSCKYGAACRYNHPDIYAIHPPITTTLGQTLAPLPAATLPIGIVNPVTSFLSNPRLGQTSLSLGPVVYPQRPGETECDYYMKTGECKFGERCKFHHPIDRSAPAPSTMKQIQQTVKLTLAGLPRRDGAVVCAFYMKTGTCKFGPACKFDHPPPGEAIAMATVQAANSTASEDENEED